MPDDMLDIYVEYPDEDVEEEVEEPRWGPFIRGNVFKDVISFTEINTVLEDLMYEHNIFTYHYDCEDGRYSFPCCSSCGGAGVPEDYGNNYVFFNVQTFDASFTDEGVLTQPLYLQWGNGVDFDFVRNIFAEHGLRLEGGDRAKALTVEGRIK